MEKASSRIVRRRNNGAIIRRLPSGGKDYQSIQRGSVREDLTFLTSASYTQEEGRWRRRSFKEELEDIIARKGPPREIMHNLMHL